MENTLEKKSGILYLKSKFFLVRIFSYFSFLLIPVWLQKTLDLSELAQVFMMGLYIAFMCGQWFLLGKEIDHRLRIYYRVNSSMDRVVYRLILGMAFFYVYFTLLATFPTKWAYNAFWVTWAVLGLFYSWPTRGKIIQESVTSNFTEFRYLDSFEKTLVCLVLVMFVVSIPELPKLTNQEALKLYFDPAERFSSVFWDFMSISYLPFHRYPSLQRIAWSMHFYAVGTGFFLFAFYALLRFVVSRRLSLLGIFALISSWSFTKVLAGAPATAIATTFSLIWVWAISWSVIGGTYRAGLFLGITGFLGVVNHQSFFLVTVAQLFVTYFVFLKDKTYWFRRQFLKYCSAGVILAIFVLLMDGVELRLFDFSLTRYWEHVNSVVNRKAFNALMPFGLLILFAKILNSKIAAVVSYKCDLEMVKRLLVSMGVLTLGGVILEPSIIENFYPMWVAVLFALIPLELIFQTISRLRSNRNMIYLIYILICLLDSHFEGRVKIFLRLLS
jgi:hypothetical protein